MKTINNIFKILSLSALVILASCDKSAESGNKEKLENNKEFPFFIPAEKPDRPLSAAVKRNYEAYEISDQSKQNCTHNLNIQS